MAGIVADIFAPLTFSQVLVGNVEGAIADVEGAVSVTEGLIADIEGFIADMAAIWGDILTVLYWMFAIFWIFMFWLFVIITIIDVIILLTFGQQEIYDIEDNIANVGILLDTFFNKTFKEFFTKYLTSIFQCAGKMIKNFPGCIIWYILEIIGQIMYLPFRIVFWLFCLQDFERMMWSTISKIDDYIHKFTGFSLIHYPDFIIQDCYVCNLEELPVVQPAPKMKSEEIPWLIPYPFFW